MQSSVFSLKPQSYIFVILIILMIMCLKSMLLFYFWKCLTKYFVILCYNRLIIIGGTIWNISNISFINTSLLANGRYYYYFKWIWYCIHYNIKNLFFWYSYYDVYWNSIFHCGLIVSRVYFNNKISIFEI